MGVETGGPSEEDLGIEVESEEPSGRVENIDEAQNVASRSQQERILADEHRQSAERIRNQSVVAPMPSTPVTGNIDGSFTSRSPKELAEEEESRARHHESEVERIESGRPFGV